MSAQRPFFVTTPIYYVNDLPHLGHAYTTVACDALARFMRLDGRRVKFLTGTDEHGQKVEQVGARRPGSRRRSSADRVSREVPRMTRLMNISQRRIHPHHRAAPHARVPGAVAGAARRRGEIYLGSFAGWYSVRDEAFYDESELVDGNARRPAPRSNGSRRRIISSACRLGRTGCSPITRRNPDSVAPRGRRNEVISFVKGGLKDLSISRTSFTWGIPVPGNPEHVMYVWLDALTNYITAARLSRRRQCAFSTSLARRSSYGR